MRQGRGASGCCAHALGLWCGVDAQGPGAAVFGVDADKVVVAAQVMTGTEGHPCLGHGSCWRWLARVHYRDTVLQGWQVACRIMQFYRESSQTRT